jgi:hypothetical protein
MRMRRSRMALVLRGKRQRRFGELPLPAVALNRDWYSNFHAGDKSGAEGHPVSYRVCAARCT